MSDTAPIVHFFNWDKKFVPPFIRFVSENFDKDKHRFIVYGPVSDIDIAPFDEIVHYPKPLQAVLPICTHLRGARKVILHGLISTHALYILALQPWVLKKCYWAIWGRDLYSHNSENRDWRWRKNEILRRFIISRIGHLVSHIKGDYHLAQQWYGAKGVWHECFMYPSNLYHEYPNNSLPKPNVHILLGNSATHSNNHFEAIEILKPYTEHNIKIYCPLSYGVPCYAQKVSEFGLSVFGSKFIALREFMPLSDYLALLANIDIAIFNHNRQQAMGNATTLLGMGKKVFMKKSVTPYSMFADHGIKVLPVEDFDLSPLESDLAEQNRNRIRSYFSESNLVDQWSKIFE